MESGRRCSGRNHRRRSGFHSNVGSYRRCRSPHQETLLQDFKIELYVSLCIEDYVRFFFIMDELYGHENLERKSGKATCKI